ncbi:peptide methionine sulfoxide reductase-like [Lineus longissimus]|uniref:peptide methionine sulfoxide reductase-like n=1 Tax=Lineus longissimus TaxID=88925 RepID=UPI00315D305A
MFWKNHDTTSCKSRQYMSAIFFHDDEQKDLAEQSMVDQQRSKSKTIQTKILPAETFYDAENYHQKYLLRQHPSLFNSLRLGDEDLIKSHIAARLNGYIGGYGQMHQFARESKKMGLSEEQTEYVVDNV